VTAIKQRLLGVAMLFFQAGQATESECLVAVGLAAGDDGQVDTCLVADSENNRAIANASHN